MHNGNTRSRREKVPEEIFETKMTKNVFKLMSKSKP